jgi:4-hydroxy-2-oxoheptanedioate aldolase
MTSPRSAAPGSGAACRFLWLTLPGGLIAGELARASGLPCLVDLQHGHATHGELVAMIAAIRQAGQEAFVRPPLGDTATAARALDAGATGIVFPMVDTVADARALVEATKYPPVGRRSWGPSLAAALMDMAPADYLARANGLVRVFAMIESARAVENVEAIAATPGLDGLFVGPYDLSISLLDGAAADPTHPDVEAALRQVLAAARAHGLAAGIYCSDGAQAGRREREGFSFLSTASDAAVLKAGVAALTGGQSR